MFFFERMNYTSHFQKKKKKLNHNTFRLVMILSLDPDEETNFQPFSNSES